MSYLSTVKKRRRNPLKKIFFILVICLILGFFAKDIIVRTITSVSLGFKGVIAFVVPSGFRSEANIIEENENLRSAVLKLTAENADRNVLYEENQNLKYELGRGATSTNTAKGILAIIKQSPGETPFDTFLIDAGTEEGVAIDDNVSYGNLVIGKIIDVGNSFAKAKLFSSPGNIFSGSILGTDIKVEAKGLGGGMFEALVPESAIVKEGDALILPSIQSKVFGLILKIENKESEGFKRLLFTLPVNPNQIYSVIVTK